MKTKMISVATMIFFSSLGLAQQTPHEHHTQTVPTEVEETQTGVTLEQLEQMALQNNPTLMQAGAAVKAAEGRKAQSNLYPNPIVGIALEDFSLHDTHDQTDRHLFFNVEQTILLGGKRGKAGTFFEQQ